MLDLSRTDLVLDLSRTETCPHFLQEGILSSVQKLVLDKSRASFRPRQIEGKFPSSINRRQDLSSINREEDSVLNKSRGKFFGHVHDLRTC